MYKIIDGNKISKEIFSELSKEYNELVLKRKKITLADVQVGDDPASAVYVKNKFKKFSEVGINFKHLKFDENISEKDLLELINTLNNDKSINAIFVELPLPKHINEKKIINMINPTKDVDGFNTINMGSLVEGLDGFFPCTAEGIIELIKRSNISIEGKHCVIIGRSNIVGKPIALLMLKENATVTICHSKTLNIKDICKTADILVVATGKPKSIDETYIKNNAVVIDVGIHREKNGDKISICGDVDFDKVASHTSYITPVPGGVGPMTITMLIKHCINSIKNE